MMPIYGRMIDSNPHQKNQFEYQSSFPSHNFPLNLSNPPMSYQSLPQYGNYAYPYPMPFGSCCNHGNLPGFHNHVPFCPPPQPPHHYCPGQTYPACYLPPPPYYSPGAFGYHDPTMKNNMAWNQDRHFFGSPHQDSEDRDEPALIPVRIKGYPYPVAWVPPEYVKPLDETRARDQKVVKENGENLTPIVWVPHGGKEEEGKRVKEDEKESGDQEKQFRFPIVWMPTQEARVKKDVAEAEKTKEQSPPPQRIEDIPFILKFLPVEEKLGSGGDGAGAKAEVRAETRKDNALSEDRAEAREDEAKREDRAETRKEEAKRVERAKTRKDVPVKQELPPVCLRVDPLPKKKKNENGDSRSRSPSPPKQKASTDKPLSNNEKPKEPVVVVEKAADRPRSNKEEPQEPVVVMEKVIDRPQSKNEEPKEPVVVVDKVVDGPQVERKEVAKKPLSELEAAQRIQSAYRGYETRRSQPLKKLKQISEVRKQVADIGDRIRALELSSDVRKDDKNRLMMGETIMRLLLQLDTIQGLLPSLRDVRKTLAKELVSLQEKLDSLGNKPEKPELETCASLPVDVGSVEVESKPEEAEETPVIEPEKTESETCSSGSADVLGIDNEEVKCKQENPEDTVVIQSGSHVAETCPSGAVDVQGVEVDEVKCNQDKPEETHVIEPEKPKSETFSAELVDVLSVQTEDVKCKQETPEETHVIEPESETCISGPVNMAGVEAEAVECKLEKQQSGPVDVLESEKPEAETCHSGPVDVLDVKAEEVEYRQEKPEETQCKESENPEFEICHSGPVDVESIQEKPEETCAIQFENPELETCNSGPVDVLDVEAHAIESEQKKQEKETRRDSNCDDVVRSDFERELTDTTQAANTLKPEKADEAELKEDSKETHVMENPDVELDHKSAKGDNLSDKDLIKVEQTDQALEALDNEKLRDMMEKLLEAGEKQLNAISGLNARVKDLEKKLYSRNKLRTKKNHNRRSVVKNAK